MNVRRMTDTDLHGKRVLIREDLNCPVKDGAVTSDARIRAALPTIRYALDQHAQVFVVSHLGRPKEGEFDEALSLKPVAARLAELLGKPVPLKRDWPGSPLHAPSRGGGGDHPPCRARHSGAPRRGRRASCPSGSVHRLWPDRRSPRFWFF
jgi:hypothetical protein